MIAVIIQLKTASPGEAVHLSDLQIQLSAVHFSFDYSHQEQERHKVTPMTEENKLSGVFYN